MQQRTDGDPVIPIKLPVIVKNNSYSKNC